MTPPLSGFSQDWSKTTYDSDDDDDEVVTPDYSGHTYSAPGFAPGFAPGSELGEAEAAEVSDGEIPKCTSPERVQNVKPPQENPKPVIQKRNIQEMLCYYNGGPKIVSVELKPININN